MFSIDSTRCSGCGICADVCPQGAISLDNNVAVIHEEKCNRCGTCADVCPVGAIGEVVPAQVKMEKGVERMAYGYGRGFGFRGSAPSWPYAGRGRGGLPRCWHPGLGGAGFASPPARTEELGYLKSQAEMMKSQLEDIESRIKELEKEN